MARSKGFATMTPSSRIRERTCMAEGKFLAATAFVVVVLLSLLVLSVEAFLFSEEEGSRNKEG